MKFIKDNSQTMAEWINAVLNKNCVQKEDIKFSSGLLVALIIMYFAVLAFFKTVAKIPFDIKYFLIGFFIFAMIINSWIFTGRMKNLSKETFASN